MTDDPFDRAVHRTSMLSAMRGPSTRDALRMITFMEVSMLVIWGVILGVHWWLLPGPQWLRTAHAVLFLMGVAFVLFNLAFLKFVRRQGWMDVDEIDAEEV